MSSAVLTSPPPSTQESKKFTPGTTGWIASDLDQAKIDEIWSQGRFEMIEGIIALMPPAKHIGTNPSGKLVMLLSRFDAIQDGTFHFELDLEVADNMVLRPDVCWTSVADEINNRQLLQSQGRRVGDRFVVPPTLVVESISLGYERHDRHHKMNWYAKFGVPNYWIIDGYRKRLDCYVLKAGAYAPSAQGQNDEVVSPIFFVPVQIPLKSLWIID